MTEQSKSPNKATKMLGMIPSDALWWFSEIRIYAAAFAAVAATASFVANYYHTRLSAVVSAESKATDRAEKDQLNLEITRAQERSATLELAAEAARLEQQKLRESSMRIQLELEQERTRRARLELITAWRRIDENLHKALVSALKTKTFARQIFVSTVKSDPEAIMFAEDVVAVLRDAGIDVHGPHTTYITAMGIGVISSPHAEASALKLAFQEVGLSLQDKPSQNIATPEYVELLVGSKQAPN